MQSTTIHQGSTEIIGQIVEVTCLKFMEKGEEILCFKNYSKRDGEPEE